MWAPPPREKGVFISHWLNAANSDPTSWKCEVVRGPHRCPKIPAQRALELSKHHLNLILITMLLILRIKHLVT
jgi:hypothetical protein